MDYIFLVTLKRIIHDLKGTTYFPRKTKSDYHIGVFFSIKGNIFTDNLFLKCVPEERDCGVIIKSNITLGRSVSLAEYTFILVGILEDFYCDEFIMNKRTFRFYQVGGKMINRYKICLN